MKNAFIQLAQFFPGSEKSDLPIMKEIGEIIVAEMMTRKFTSNYESLSEYDKLNFNQEIKSSINYRRIDEFPSMRDSHNVRVPIEKLDIIIHNADKNTTSFGIKLISKTITLVETIGRQLIFSYGDIKEDLKKGNKLTDLCSLILPDNAWIHYFQPIPVNSYIDLTTDI